jgi:hypothetical protein
MKAWLAVGAALIVVLALGYHRTKVNHLENKVVETEIERNRAWSDLAQAHTNISTLEQAVFKQNRYIEQVRERGAAANEATKQEVLRVRNENKALASRVTMLLTTARPAGMTACTNAERLINEEIAGLSAVGGLR